MGRRAVPELPAIEQTSDEELPVFGSEAEASAAPGGKPSSYAVREGNIPMVGNAATPMRASAPRPVAPPPKRYRVMGLEHGGKLYIDQSGRTARMVPNKILDERYFNIGFLKSQGFTLVEVTDGAPQIGRIL